MNPEQMAVRPCPIWEAAQAAPGRVALTFGSERWTWSELDGRTARWAGRLAELGVGEGDTVALFSFNRPEFLFATWAAARLGAWVVPLNARLSAFELAPLIARVRPRLLLVDPALHAEAALPRNHELPPGEQLPAELRATSVHALDALDVDRASPHQGRTWRARGPLVGLFTSGTTGRPKLALHGVAQFEAASRASAQRIGGVRAPVWLGTLPLFHVGGLAMSFRVVFGAGTLVLRARFDADETSRAFDEDGITHASLVPTTLARVLDVRGEQPFPPTAQAVLIGGGPMSAELLARARRLGLPCLQTYGMTEACSQITTEDPADADGGSAGPPLPGTEVRIVDDAGVALAAGVEGNIEVRGPTLFQGYFEDPEATARAFHDEWFRTGDLGVLDTRGRLVLLSRRTDLILRGGENVYPSEIEHVLEQHPAVAEVAVLAEPDETWGQVPVAVVCVRSGAALDAAALEAFARARLASFKIPARWRFTDALPRNAMGKVDRVRLRSVFA